MLSSTSIEHIDTSQYSKQEIEHLIRVSNKDLVLLYMPDLNYKEMQDLEDFARENQLKLINIPVTLPVMDIVKQAEYAGIEITNDFVIAIRNGIRKLITDTLNEEV